MAIKPVRPGFVQEAEAKKAQEEKEQKLVEIKKQKELNKKQKEIVNKQNSKNKEVDKEDIVSDDKKPNIKAILSWILVAIACIAATAFIVMQKRSDVKKTNIQDVTKKDIQASYDGATEKVYTYDDEYENTLSKNDYEAEADDLYNQAPDSFNISKEEFINEYVELRNNKMSNYEASDVMISRYSESIIDGDYTESQFFSDSDTDNVSENEVSTDVIIPDVRDALDISTEDAEDGTEEEDNSSTNVDDQSILIMYK